MFWNKNITAKKIDRNIVDIENNLRMSTLKKVTKIMNKRTDKQLFEPTKNGSFIYNEPFNFWRLMGYAEVFYSGNLSTFIASFVSVPKIKFEQFKKELFEEFIDKFCRIEVEIEKGKKYSEEEMKEFFIFSKIHDYVPVDKSMMIEQKLNSSFEDVTYQEVE